MNETAAPDIDNPELVRWSPKRGLAFGEGGPRPAVYILALVGAASMGAVAIGALAIGALAIGQLAVGRAAIRQLKIGRLEVDDLVVRRRAARPF